MNAQRMLKARVAIVEDHRLQRVRTEELLAGAGAYEVVFSGETVPEFARWSESVPRQQRPHILILDLMVDRQPSASPVPAQHR